MTRNSRFVAGSMVVAFALGIALAAVVVAQAPPPGLGTWTLNVAKSKFSPGPAAKSGSATFTAVGSSIKAVVDTVTGDGQKVHWEVHGSPRREAGAGHQQSRRRHRRGQI